MKLFERAGIRTTDAAGAAAVSFHEYVSDRSAALLLREQPRMLEIGSVVCVQIGNYYLAATAAHNVQHTRRGSRSYPLVNNVPRHCAFAG